MNRIVEEDIRREATEEGRKEGRKEGEKQKALEIARNLKASGMTLSDIIKFTGLTEKDLLE